MKAQKKADHILEMPDLGEFFDYCFNKSRSMKGCHISIQRRFKSNIIINKGGGAKNDIKVSTCSIRIATEFSSSSKRQGFPFFVFPQRRKDLISRHSEFYRFDCILLDWIVVYWMTVYIWLNLNWLELISTELKTLVIS